MANLFVFGVVLSALTLSPITNSFSTSGQNEPRSNQGAVVSNGLECAGIMRQMLDIGGSAADATIAGMLCESVASPQSTGLGGGFIATIYIKETNQVETLIARDIAPLAATEDMFVNSNHPPGKTISVPGELKGYWELHQRYGKLKWSQLFDPVIELCRKGHAVSPYVSKIFRNYVPKEIIASPTLSKIFVDPKTNDLYKEGDLVKREKLAETLEIIKNEGVDTMYNNGTIGRWMVQDIQEAGGIITMEDFMRYNVRWEKPVTSKLKDGKTLHGVPLPGSGALVAFIMNLLGDYLPHKESVLSLQRIAEAFKFAFAKRAELGDDRFDANVLQAEQNLTDLKFAMRIRQKIDDSQTHTDVKYYETDHANANDHGTANINVVAPNGDAIAATGSINGLFGCKIVSSRTGIILNSGMDDFSTPGLTNAYGIPPSPANFIRPQKMPMSSMTPTILLDKNGDVEFVLGSAGGSKITTAIAYALLRYLYFNETAVEALHAPRIHHQLLPMVLEMDPGFHQDLIDGMANKGHQISLNPEDGRFGAITAIARDGNRLIPIFDHRRGGSVELI